MGAAEHGGVRLLIGGSVSLSKDYCMGLGMWLCSESRVWPVFSYSSVDSSSQSFPVFIFFTLVYLMQLPL